jgi:hypothetical protein
VAFWLKSIRCCSQIQLMKPDGRRSVYMQHL